MCVHFLVRFMCLSLMCGVDCAFFFVAPIVLYVAPSCFACVVRYCALCIVLFLACVCFVFDCVCCFLFVSCVFVPHACFVFWCVVNVGVVLRVLFFVFSVFVCERVWLVCRKVFPVCLYCVFVIATLCVC